MLRGPLAAKNFADHFGPEKLQKPKKKPLVPLDPRATAGQSCVCVSVNVLVSVCVCGEGRRCGVVTLKSPKKHISLCPSLSLSISKTNYLCVSFYHTLNHKTNGSFTFIS